MLPKSQLYGRLKSYPKAWSWYLLLLLSLLNILSNFLRVCKELLVILEILFQLLAFTTVLRSVVIFNFVWRVVPMKSFLKSFWMEAVQIYCRRSILGESILLFCRVFLTQTPQFNVATPRLVEKIFSYSGDKLIYRMKESKYNIVHSLELREILHSITLIW